jgi:hypothetical protein
MSALVCGSLAFPGMQRDHGGCAGNIAYNLKLLTAFHPGAMMDSHVNRIDGEAGVRVAIVAPDGPQGMLQHADALSRAGIPLREEIFERCAQAYEAGVRIGTA